MRIRQFLAAALAALALGHAGPAAAQAEQPAPERPATILVLDASGSMWGQIDGVAKIAIAREVVARILGDFPADENLGLIAYGHRQRGRCDDIETLVAPAPGTAGRIVEIVNALNPRGMTPMADSVIAAAGALRSTEQAATVILVSDGIETCHADPCAAARALAEAGVDFTTHVIGFDVKGEAEALAQMRCLAEETGGRFLTADNADELAAALEQVVAAPPELHLTLWARLGDPGLSEPRWHEGEAAGLAPVEGPVTWSVTDAESNPVVDEAEGNPLSLTLPAGDYVVTAHAAVLERSGRHELALARGGAVAVAAEFPGRLPEPEPESALPGPRVSGPAKVRAGEAVPISWEEAIDGNDYVAIVPAGAAEWNGESYGRVGSESMLELAAPGDPGLYDIAYVHDADNRVMARSPLEVTEPGMRVSGPATVRTGEAVPISWEDAVNSNDYVAIVPAGAAAWDGESYGRVGSESMLELAAPGDPGLYDIAYILDVNSRVVARSPLEVTEPGTRVSGPAKVRAGEAVAISWEDAVNSNDYVAIVPAGAAAWDGESYGRVRSERMLELAAPDEPGLYDIAYILDVNSRVVARSPLEVLEADAPLDGGAGLVVPASAAPGATITVTWTHEGGGDTRVALARADQPDFSWISAESAAGRQLLELVLPGEAGRYEVRFLDVAAREVLGRAIVMVGD